jgi:hypothetical protein
MVAQEAEWAAWRMMSACGEMAMAARKGDASSVEWGMREEMATTAMQIGGE